jgi:hypothetical protein
MTIYSSLPPTHQLPREPINALRARQGLRPMCFDRPDYDDLVTVRDGLTWDGRQAFATVPNDMSKDCRSWDVRAPDEDVPGDAGEDPATESIPGRESWRCHGCRHLPTDLRVIERANKSEAV